MYEFGYTSRGKSPVLFGGEDTDPSGLNRDTDNLTNDIYAVDRQQGNIDLTVDHRLLSEEGRAEIAEDFDEIRQSAQVAYIRLTEDDSTSRDIRITAIDELGLSWGESGELVNRDDVQAIAEAADEFYDALAGNPVSWFVPEADDTAIGSSAEDSSPNHEPLDILLTEGGAGDVILTNIVEVAGNVAAKLEQVDPRLAAAIELGLSAAGGVKSAVQYVVEKGIAETPLGDVFAEFVQHAGQMVSDMATGNDADSRARIAEHGSSAYIDHMDKGGTLLAGVALGTAGSGGITAAIKNVGSNKGSSNSQSSNNTEVQELEVNSYRNLKSREVVGDGLEHDHIPSFAALKAAEEAKLGRKLTPGEERILYNNATAVEIPREIHQGGRTYGGRNTAEQISQDAADLCGAVCRDTEVLKRNLLNKGYDPSLVNETIEAIIKRNADLGG